MRTRLTPPCSLPPLPRPTCFARASCSTYLATRPLFISFFSFPTRRTMKRTMKCFFQKKVPSTVPSPAPAPAPPVPSPFASQRHHHGWSENRLPWALAGTNDPPPGEPPPKKAKKVGKRTRTLTLMHLHAPPPTTRTSQAPPKSKKGFKKGNKMFKTPKALEGLARARVMAAAKTEACKLAEIAKPVPSVPTKRGRIPTATYTPEEQLRDHRRTNSSLNQGPV